MNAYIVTATMFRSQFLVVADSVAEALEKYAASREDKFGAARSVDKVDVHSVIP